MAIVHTALRDRRRPAVSTRCSTACGGSSGGWNPRLHAAGFVSYEAAPAFDRPCRPCSARLSPPLVRAILRGGNDQLSPGFSRRDFVGLPPTGRNSNLAAFRHRRRVCRGHRPAPRADRRGRNLPGELHLPPQAAVPRQSVGPVHRPHRRPAAALCRIRRDGRLRRLLGVAGVVLRAGGPADRLPPHERHDCPRPLVRRGLARARRVGRLAKRTGPRTP